jgi:transcriptional regulator with XRE-family HTH domain
MTGAIALWMATSKWTPSAIRALRTRLGLTQEAFAQKVGVAFTTANRWERGKVAPPKGVYAARLEAVAGAIEKGLESPPLRLSNFKPLRVILPATEAVDFGGPTIEEMKERWGRAPPSVMIAGGEISPVWEDA